VAKRPSIAAALDREAAGKEAIYNDHARPSPSPARGATWEETHSRATFHLSREVQDAVTEAAAKSGRSKSQVVSDALRQHLKLKG
jgi:Ribbon-helix-helix protein, copG family